MVSRLREYKIVDLTHTMLDEVLEIEQKSFKTPWSRDAFEAELDRNKCAHYRVLLAEGRVAAYGGLWQIVDEGHITNIAVHPDFRGRGFGDAVVLDMTACAKSLGIVALTLEVRTGNVPAIGLYKKHGFEEIAIRKGYYADTGEDAIIMWKNDLTDESADL